MIQEIYHSHDALFKAAMADLEVAEDLIKAHIPVWLSHRVRWNSLALNNSNFIKEDLRQLHSDVVYLCQLDDESDLYFLLEHQSRPDRYIGFRILKYQLYLMEQHLAQGHAHFPLIQSICIYAGKHRPYPYSLDLQARFKNTELAKALMFAFPVPILGDLTRCTEEGFKRYGRSEFLLQLLNQGSREEFYNWLQSHPDVLEELLKKSYNLKGISYILAHEEHHSSGEILDLIISMDPIQKPTIMSAAQELVNKGVEEGREEGMYSRNLAIATSMLTKGYPTQEVLDLTGLRAEDIRLLKHP